jgi:hypothetical protein
VVAVMRYAAAYKPDSEPLDQFMPLPLRQRKDRLARLLARVQVGIALNEHTDAKGELVFRQACAMGLEGIVSKRLGERCRGTSGLSSKSGDTVIP